MPRGLNSLPLSSTAPTNRQATSAPSTGAQYYTTPWLSTAQTHPQGVPQQNNGFGALSPLPPLQQQTLEQDTNIIYQQAPRQSSPVEQTMMNQQASPVHHHLRRHHQPSSQPDGSTANPLLPSPPMQEPQQPQGSQQPPSDIPDLGGVLANISQIPPFNPGFVHGVRQIFLWISAAWGEPPEMVDGQEYVAYVTRKFNSFLTLLGFIANRRLESVTEPLIIIELIRLMVNDGQIDRSFITKSFYYAYGMFIFTFPFSHPRPPPPFCSLSSFPAVIHMFPTYSQSDIKAARLYGFRRMLEAHDYIQRRVYERIPPVEQGSFWPAYPLQLSPLPDEPPNYGAPYGAWGQDSGMHHFPKYTRDWNAR
ncbi:hypothetical protein F4779DRAFT_616302 [Xylariaceae sp. FL0662B]|nr:hypothetical protein F4779DRAFT_616302 [Xylariaceae sp. FL0662B]